MGMMESSSAVILNNWKVGLTVSVPPVGVWLGLAGSHSKLAQFVMQKSRQDKYSFISHEVSCHHYRFRVSRTPPLAQDFIQTVKNLPSAYNKTSQPEYHHLIQTYGTHYVSQVYLGGRARDVTAVRVCQAALEDLSVEEIEDCLSMEASLNLKLISLGAGFSKCKKQRTAMSSQQSFHEHYRERLVEVEGGQNTADLLFSSTSAGAFSEWVKTVKSLPGLLTYSLRPIHTLVQQDSAKREALRQAVSEYILKRALRRNCIQSCPRGAWPSALDPCSCTSSPGDGFINPFGCSQRRGLGKLQVTVERANGLRGDVFSKTDAYVKVFFVGREIRTWIIGNNDNPVWNKVMDFGSVHVTAASHVKVEVWDKDLLRDDHLGSCIIRLSAGRPHHRECYLKRGHIRLSYSLRCGPHLGGPSCSEYVSQPQPQHAIAMGKYPL
nr:perforin-1-like [Pelodiscus sinensis]|eukprot:XP_006134430.1 perforin-1-like [Pelodiscus sinensis]